MLFKKILIISLVFSALCFSLISLALAEDIASQCEYISDSRSNTKALYDGRFNKTFDLEKNQYLEVNSDKAIVYLYINFLDVPSSWKLEILDNQGNLQSSKLIKQEYLNQLIKLDGVKHFKIAPENKEQTIGIWELALFDSEDLPQTVQKWQSLDEKADLMIAVAHPDDEFLFLGGMIPSYASHKKIKLVYLSHGIPIRKQELLKALWHCGLKYYPDIGEFRDIYSTNLAFIEKKWDYDKVLAHMVKLIRKYQPDVLVSHDINGEYGHAAHKLCAKVASDAFDYASKKDFIKDIEPWDIKKLYLHLGNKNLIKLDWNKPLAAFENKSSLEIAREAFKLNASQQFGRKVQDGGRFDNSIFSLIKSRVYEDRYKNDIFENIK